MLCEGVENEYFTYNLLFLFLLVDEQLEVEIAENPSEINFYIPLSIPKPLIP